MRTNDPLGGADPYEVLGLSRGCTLEEVSQAYHSLARRYHPDVSLDPDAAARMRLINLAVVRVRRELAAQGARRSWPATATAQAVPRTQATPARPARAVSPPPPAASASATQASQASQARPPEQAAPARRTSPHPLHGFAMTMSALARRPRAERPQRSATRAERPQRSATRRKRHMATLPVIAAVVVMLVMLLGGLAFLADLAIQGHGRVSLTLPSPTQASGGDGTDILLGQTSHIQLMGYGTATIQEREIAVLPAGLHLVEDPQWSSDGRYVALSVGNESDPTQQMVYVLHDASIVLQLPGFSPRWAPQGDQLALLAKPAGAPTAQLELVDSLSGKAPIILDTQAGSRLAWSPDGTRIAYSAAAQRGVRLADVRSHAVSSLLSLPASQHMTLAGWIAGSLVVGFLRAHKAIELVGVPADGSAIMSLADLTGEASPPPWSLDGNQLLYVTQLPNAPSATLHIVSPSAQTAANLTDAPAARFFAGWSSDARWLALAPGGKTPRSEICFVVGPLAPSSLTTCLSLSGTVIGLAWEPAGAMLSYVRLTHAGGALELRQLTLARSVSGTPGAVGMGARSRVAGDSAGDSAAGRGIRAVRIEPRPRGAELTAMLGWLPLVAISLQYGRSLRGRQRRSRAI